MPQLLNKVICISKFPCIALLMYTVVLSACAKPESNNFTEQPTKVTSLRNATPSEQSNNLDVGYLVGQKAPDFKITDTEMATYSIKDYANRSVILYFYASW